MNEKSPARLLVFGNSVFAAPFLDTTTVLVVPEVTNENISPCLSVISKVYTTAENKSPWFPLHLCVFVRQETGVVLETVIDIPQLLTVLCLTVQ